MPVKKILWLPIHRNSESVGSCFFATVAEFHFIALKKSIVYARREYLYILKSENNLPGSWINCRALALQVRSWIYFPAQGGRKQQSGKCLQYVFFLYLRQLIFRTINIYTYI